MACEKNTRIVAGYMGMSGEIPTAALPNPAHSLHGALTKAVNGSLDLLERAVQEVSADCISNCW